MNLELRTAAEQKKFQKAYHDKIVQKLKIAREGLHERLLELSDISLCLPYSDLEKAIEKLDEIIFELY